MCYWKRTTRAIFPQGRIDSQPQVDKKEYFLFFFKYFLLFFFILFLNLVFWVGESPNREDLAIRPCFYECKLRELDIIIIIIIIIIVIIIITKAFI